MPAFTSAVHQRLGALRRSAGFGRFALRRSVTPYVGWPGEGNIGDEAMLLAHRQLFPDLSFLSVPAGVPAGAARTMSSIPGPRCEAICLGGGTLVGNGHFRGRLQTAITAWPDALRFAVGVGVEDPGYRVGLRTGVAAELDRWTPLLEDFAYVGVRGPLSQSALAELGIDSEVVGDPALSLRVPGRPPEEGLLGLNVGIVDDQWGQDPGGFRRQIIQLVGSLRAEGWRILLVSTFAPDAHFQSALADELGSGVELAGRGLGVFATMEQLARCQLVVAHKLHAAVLGAAAGAPAIALEYRPKCRDFQESVGRGEYVMRTDRMQVEVIREWVGAIACNREAQVSQLRQRVEALRATREAAARRLHAALSGCRCDHRQRTGARPGE